MLEVTVKVWESFSKFWKRKRKAPVGRICRKRFWVWNEREKGWWKTNIAVAVVQLIAPWHRVYTLQPVVQPAVGTQPVVGALQPVGWTMQMSPAKRLLSGPARTLMTSLGRRLRGQYWRCGAFDRNLKKIILIYLFIFTLGSIWSWGMTEIRSIIKLYKTLFLFIYYMNIQNVWSSRLYVVHAQPAAECKRALTHAAWRRLCSRRSFQ